MKHLYRENIETTDCRDSYTLKGKKGTKIYKEVRSNHIQGMVLFSEGEEIPLHDMEYLVFDIPFFIDLQPFSSIRRIWPNLTVQSFEGRTEIACHHPHVFHCGLLSVLHQLGLIQLTWKQSPLHSREFAPFYVNPKGMKQWMYNIGSLSIFEIRKLSSTRKKRP